MNWSQGCGSAHGCPTLLRPAGKAKYNEQNAEQVDRAPWPKTESEHCMFRDKRRMTDLTEWRETTGDCIGKTAPTALKSW